MKGQFTEEAETAIDKAAKFAAKMESAVIGTEHLLYGLCAAPGLASRILKENGLEKEVIRFQIQQYIGNGATLLMEKADGTMSPKLEELLVKSSDEAVRMEAAKVGTEHILLVILKDTVTFMKLIPLVLLQ